MQISINGKLTVNIDELTLNAAELEQTILTVLNNETPICIRYLLPTFSPLTDAHLYTEKVQMVVEEDIGDVLMGLAMCNVGSFKLETSSKSIYLEVKQ